MVAWTTSKLLLCAACMAAGQAQSAMAVGGDDVDFDFRNPLPRRKVPAVPGVPDTAPYEYYTGYLNASTPPSGRGTMFFHYICALAPDWENQPLIIWYNGGPGAPSTYGLFQEFGPFLLTANSFNTDGYRKTGVPTPLRNKYTWANDSSLCEIDSPAPMGASYCTEGNGTAGSTGGPSGDAYSCGAWTDTTVAKANHEAHRAFFRDAFPEFVKNKNKVSIVGESYAGIYIPYFIDAWLKDPLPGVNLYGFAIGDGCTACIPMDSRAVNWCIDLNHNGLQYPNSLPGPFWDMEFFHGHSQFSDSTYKEMKETCMEDELLGIAQPADWTAACNASIEKMAEEVGFYYAYNLFEACPDEVGVDGTRHTVFEAYGDGDSGLGAPCLTDSMEVYFGLNVTQQAFGIPADNNFIVLDNGIGMNYTIDAPFVGPIYERAVNAGLQILVYEGDSDASGLQTNAMEAMWVPFFGKGSGEWTPAGRLDGNNPAGRPLNLTMTQSWRPFGVLPAGRPVQGGYLMEWAGGQVTFASIRGAGHLAPLYRPSAAYTVMHAFVTNTSMPAGLKPPV